MFRANFPTVCFKTMAPQRSSIHNNNHHLFMSVLIPCYFISKGKSPQPHQQHWGKKICWFFSFLALFSCRYNDGNNFGTFLQFCVSIEHRYKLNIYELSSNPIMFKIYGFVQQFSHPKRNKALSFLNHAALKKRLRRTASETRTNKLIYDIKAKF